MPLRCIVVLADSLISNRYCHKSPLQVIALAPTQNSSPKDLLEDLMKEGSKKTESQGTNTRTIFKRVTHPHHIQHIGYYVYIIYEPKTSYVYDFSPQL